MIRDKIVELCAWKASPHRKPLLLLGARQVGKTYLIKEFGAAEFRRVHAFNFEADRALAKIFDQNLDPDRIVRELSFRTAAAINPMEDLLFFDEIQTAPLALTSLKHFHERMPQLAICGAGSLLGLHLTPASFPVGYVEFLYLHPLSFSEFLAARGPSHVARAHHEALSGAMLPELAHLPLWDVWREYLVIGGLPEAVSEYLTQEPGTLESFQRARKTQARLVTAYLADVAKHAGKTNAMHIERIWNAVPSQMAAAQDLSTGRFKFKDVAPGIHNYARLAGAIDWLVKAGLVIKVPICAHSELPLTAYTRENHFKLYMFDVGILGSILDLQPEVLMNYRFGTYKGFMAENLVAQELSASNQDARLFSWTEGTAEMEFLIHGARSAIPVEVKAGHRIRAKSLKSYIEKYHPFASIVISARPFAVTKSGACEHINLPLYLVPRTWDFAKLF